MRAIGELAHQARLLAPGGLLDRAAAVMPWFALARRGGDPGRHAEAVSARLAYNTEASALAEAIATLPAPDLLLEARDAVARLLAAVGPDPAPAEKALADYRQALEAARLRTQELVDCALDAAAVESLRDALRRARPGAALACEPLVQAEGLLGWGLRLQPA